MTCDRSYLENAVAALEAPAPRPLWKPSREEEREAITILLASSIPIQLRQALREREAEMSKEPA